MNPPVPYPYQMSHRIFKVPFADIYPSYVNKVERKERTEAELIEVIKWLTGYNKTTLNKLIKDRTDLETFFKKAKIHKNATLITGTICGVKIQEIEDPIMLKIRYLDKLVDELAKGRPLEKIFR